VIAAGLLLRHGVPPQATYLFKHALVQDAAYGLLLREPRRTLHARIAAALENEFAEIAEAEPEIVAQHFARAELSDRAALYFERAGDRAITRCAYAEAVAHFTASLAQFERLPQSPERSRRELAVLLKQGPAVLILRGWQHVDVEQVYQRACVIARSLDDQMALFKALWGLWFSAAVNRRTDIARERAQELVALGQRSGDESLLLEAMHCRWSTGFFRGEVTSTLADALEGASLYDPVRHSGLGATFGGHDPGVCAHSVAGLAYAQAGNPGDAVASVARAIALAQTLNQPPSEAFALMNALTVYAMVEDRDAVTRLASQTMAHADKFDLPVQRSIATFMSAWARACGDQIDAGLQAMEAEFGRVCLMGPIPDVYTGLLARVRFAAEQATQALELLDGVLNNRREPGVGVYMPELHRLRGECLLRLDPRNFDRAVRELETAVAVGKRQHAGAFHLAAAISLARTWAGAGQPRNGIVPLQEAVGTFSTDADTPQLALARAMLAGMC
jgi:tetratricopeptide (TPR) repeat protein